MYEVLWTTLTARRGSGSEGELWFREKYLLHRLNLELDAFGNAYRIIPCADGRAPTSIFVAHTDTAARRAGTQGVVVDYECGTVTGDGDDVLGADNGAGVALLAHMIEAEVPGLYVFHPDEEQGCRGSEKFVAQTLRHLALSPKRCIAFDRSGTSDAVVRIGGRRLCTDSFVEKLIHQLDLNLIPTAEGRATDVLNYAECVPECVNLSSGYYAEHTTRETLDLEFWESLATAVLAVDWEKLPTVRHPGGETFTVKSVKRWTKQPTAKELYQFIKAAPYAAAEILAAKATSFEEMTDYADQEAMPF